MFCCYLLFVLCVEKGNMNDIYDTSINILYIIMGKARKDSDHNPHYPALC